MAMPEAASPSQTARSLGLAALFFFAFGFFFAFIAVIKAEALVENTRVVGRGLGGVVPRRFDAHAIGLYGSGLLGSLRSRQRIEARAATVATAELPSFTISFSFPPYSLVTLLSTCLSIYLSYVESIRRIGTYVNRFILLVQFQRKSHQHVNL